MTPTDPGPDEPEIVSEEDFQETLEAVLRSAIEHDIDPKGSWVYRSTDETPDFEIEIVELAKKRASD